MRVQRTEETCGTIFKDYLRREITIGRCICRLLGHSAVSFCPNGTGIRIYVVSRLLCRLQIIDKATFGHHLCVAGMRRACSKPDCLDTFVCHACVSVCQQFAPVSNTS